MITMIVTTTRRMMVMIPLALATMAPAEAAEMPAGKPEELQFEYAH